VLSKGMGQKLQIICTLLHRPQLIVLDEPFSGLDPVNVELVRRVILNLKKSGVTLVISTHIMEQAEKICDEISLMNKGEAVLQGSLHSIRQQAENRITVDYTGGNPFPTALRGVESIKDFGNTAELQLSADTQPQTVLSSLLEQIDITRYDTNQTSLHEIFVACVGLDNEN
jgi:ABC-2 type transport system ATP-binding protein